MSAPTERPPLAAEIGRLRQLVSRLRATLESRSVNPVGPHSPYWRCQYCNQHHTSPIAFKHRPDCILAAPEAGTPALNEPPRSREAAALDHAIAVLHRRASGGALDPDDALAAVTRVLELRGGRDGVV